MGTSADGTESERYMTEEEEIRQIKAEQQAETSEVTLADFPRKPYALFPAGGYVGEEGVDFLIHKEISTEDQCVLLFESIVDADRVVDEYKQATGRDCEPRRIEARGIEDRFWVKYYCADGSIVIGPITAYWQHMRVSNDDYEGGN